MSTPVNVNARRVASLLTLCAVAWIGTARSASAACLARAPANLQKSPARITALVPSAEVSIYRAAGYVPSACPPTIDGLKRVVQYYCGPNPSRGVSTNVTFAIYGFSRERMCASARAGLSEAGG